MQMIPETASLPMRRIGISMTILLFINILPLVGVLMFDWSLLNVLVLYWAENLIIGAVNILRLVTCGKREPGADGRLRSAFTQFGDNLGLALFFTVHYGLFCAVHGVFVFQLFASPEVKAQGSEAYAQYLWSWRGLLIPLIGLIFSHLSSFFVNYLLGGERQRITPTELMFAPYLRIIVLHLSLLLGGFLITLIGTPTAALALLVALKTLLDVIAHVHERKRLLVSNA